MTIKFIKTKKRYFRNTVRADHGSRVTKDPEKEGSRPGQGQNISRTATEQDLEDAFAAFGEVSSASIIKDKFSGESRGFGFVEMPNKEEADKAISGLIDAAPLFAEASTKPALLMHIMRTLTPAWDITVAASSLRVPTLIAHGRYDYTVPYTSWESIADKLPDATLRIFEKSGHQPFFEETDLFASTLTDWMAGRL